MHDAETREKVREEAGEPVLRISYETHGALAAAKIGQMLQDLTKSFEDYANARSPSFQGATLAVNRLGVGSFFADLTAVGNALQVLYDHRELLAGFVTHIQGVVQTLAGFVSGHVKEVDRRAVESVYTPVAGQPVINIKINVQGSHNTVTIDRQLIERIETENAKRLGAAHAG